MENTEIHAAVKAALEEVEALHRRLSGLLADLDGAEAVQVPRQGRWTRTEFEALWQNVRHLPGVRALFDVTAANPNKAVTFTDVLTQSGLDELQQRNEHARLSRVANDLFGEKRWPIEYWQGPPPAGGGKAEMLYRMGGTVATWWIELAK